MTEPNFLQVFQKIVQKLEAAGIDYMIVGSIASMIYGEPRLTQDMDVVINIAPEQIRALQKMFGGNEYYLPPAEVLTQEALNRRSFNILHVHSGLKVDFIVKKLSAHAIEEFNRRKRINLLPGTACYIATPEDVVIKKLQFYAEGQSEKHLQDIRGIMACSELDYQYLEGWISRLHLDEAWEKTQHT